MVSWYNGMVSKSHERKYTMAVDYVTGKENSIKAKSEKILWHQQEATKHTQKAEKLREAMEKDKKTLTDIKSNLARKQADEQEIEAIKEQLRNPPEGTDIDELIDKLTRLQSGLEFLDSLVRNYYYGK